MKPIHVKRLKKLIAFLRKLPRKRFNFAIVRNEPPKCGAVGCAIGYCPNVFPRVFKSYIIPKEDRWYHRGSHGVGFREDGVRSFSSVAHWLTGLSGEAAADLFEPMCQNLVHEKLPQLPDTATPKQVARMLEKAIKLLAEK